MGAKKKKKITKERNVKSWGKSFGCQKQATSSLVFKKYDAHNCFQLAGGPSGPGLSVFSCSVPCLQQNVTEKNRLIMYWYFLKEGYTLNT